MANLIKLLRNQGYDYIDGPIRDHILLSVWNKKDLNKVYFFQMLEELYTSPYNLIKYEAPALFVDFSSSTDYNIDAGISALERLLKLADMGDLGLGAKIKGGKSVTIAYDNAKSEQYVSADLSNYFYHKDAEFKYSNPEIIYQANLNNLILITGLLYAQNLDVHIKTNTDVDSNLGAEITQLANGKIDFSLANSKEIVMKSDLGTAVPIAVKAFRLNFVKGEYKSMKPVTDHRDWF